MIPIEEWKDIPEYEGILQASNFGEVKSLTRPGNYSDKIVRKWYDKDGYEVVKLSIEGKQRTLKVHRLVALAWIPNPEECPQVHHKDGIKDHNHVNNLAWVDPSDNARLNYLAGIGSNQTLEAEEIRQIRAMKKEGYSRCRIAKIFDVAPQTIDKIINGERWGWLT